MAVEPGSAVFTQRHDEALAHIQKNPWPNPEKKVDFAQNMALLLLFKNENVAEANRMVLAYCRTNRLAGPDYNVTTRTYIWPDRKLQEVEEKNGR